MRKSIADTREFFQSRLRGIFLLALVAAAVALAPGGGLTRLMVAVGSTAAAVFSAWLYFLIRPWSGWRPKHQQTDGTILVEIECVRLDPLYQVLCQVVAPDGSKAEAHEPFALGGPPTRCSSSIPTPSRVLHTCHPFPGGTG